MKVLVVGETWMTSTTVINGVDSLPARVSSHDSAEVFTGALRAAGLVVDRMPSHAVNTDFPASADALRSCWDVVVIGDVGSDSFLLHPGMYGSGPAPADRLRAVADFTRAGGGLVMIGGYLSYSGYHGIAGYGRTALANALPVAMLDHDDRVECPEGVQPHVRLPEHPVLHGVRGDWPLVRGYNQVRSHQYADVLASVGDDPLLVVGRVGRGRSASFASDCAPHWATPEFLAWNHYGTIFSQLVRWVGGEGLIADDNEGETWQPTAG